MSIASSQYIPSAEADSTDIAGTAQALLGVSSLWPGQEEAIRAILRGRDTLVVQPTGSGKSAIYQIAGALLPGLTVVISPLIALQKDQVESIASSRLDTAAVLNSTLSFAERQETLERTGNGAVKYIFLAPEQLRNEETLERLKAAGVSLFTVDEAHCISQWGHDFRPDYLELGEALRALGHPACLAMTATASHEVRDDIVARLGLVDPVVLVQGFDRPNISLRVDSYAKKGEKRDALLRRVEFAEKPGIVYAATHKNAESIAEELCARGVQAAAYHGGMKAQDRDAIQNRFMAGEVPVIVATNAFGMGVDKPDIRFVYHADVSDSLDSYYQEIGRAGRDGRDAEAVLFYRPGEIRTQSYKTGGGTMDSGTVEAVAAAIAGHEGGLTTQELGRELGLSTRKATNLVHKLEEMGAVRRAEGGRVGLASERPPAAVAEDIAQLQEFQKELRRRRLEQMRTYAVTSSCRRVTLLRYFGEEAEGPCGNCDRCEETGAGRQHS